MSDFLPRFESIFHPSDFTAASEVAFCHALKLALAARGSLTLLHSERSHHEWHEFPGVRATLERWALLPGGSSREAIAASGIGVRKVVSHHAEPVDAVRDYLGRHPTDLIVLATHPHEGKMSWLRHSGAEPIARASHSATLFVPHGKRGFVRWEDGAVSLRNVLIPVAAGPDPRVAVAAATTIVDRLGLEHCAFHLLHVGEAGHMPALLPPEHAGWTWERETRPGKVVDTILDSASRMAADLIVMCTDGHHGFLDALRGNSTERVLRAAPCPLLAVPPRHG